MCTGAAAHRMVCLFDDCPLSGCLFDDLGQSRTTRSWPLCVPGASRARGLLTCTCTQLRAGCTCRFSPRLSALHCRPLSFESDSAHPTALTPHPQARTARPCSACGWPARQSNSRSWHGTRRMTFVSMSRRELQTGGHHKGPTTPHLLLLPAAAALPLLVARRGCIPLLGRAAGLCGWLRAGLSRFFLLYSAGLTELWHALPR